MSKYVYTTCLYKGPDDELFTKLQQLPVTGILIGGATGFPRNAELDFYTSRHPIPDVSNMPVLTFEEATELRVQEVIKIAEGNDLPIIAYWSGGIDSTVIMTAIIKHFPQHLLERVIVKMSNASYVENPHFYKKYIENKFKHEKELPYNYRNAIILHGDPADALWLGGNILTLDAVYPDANKFKLNTHKDLVINAFAEKSDVPYAQWLVDYLIEGARSSGYELDTITDLFWWLIFNHNYSAMCMKHVGETDHYDEETLNLYHKNFITWYNTDAYQAWSINAQFAGEKYDGTIRSYKMLAKQYIYDFDKNQHYRDFKSKLHSSYQTNRAMLYVSAIKDDGTIIFDD